MYYYKNEMETTPTGVIDLEDCTVHTDDANKMKHIFVLESVDRKTYLAGSSDNVILM